MAGGLFDFLLSKYLPNANWRKLYLFLFALCFIHPLILYNSKLIFVYLISMAMWGLYYDFANFGNFDFVSREIKKSEHTSSFGVLGVFKSLGYLLAPLTVGLVIGATLDVKPFILAWVFLILSFIFYILLKIYMGKNRKKVRLHRYKPSSFALEFKLWKRIGKVIFPSLVVTYLISMHDSFFWTIGPIFSESFTQFKPLDGIFLTAFSLPPLIVGWFVGGIKKKWRGKNIPLDMFFISSILLSLMWFANNPYLLIFIIFTSSSFSTLSWFILSGHYADLIEKKQTQEKEIAGVEDFSVNLGYVIGPVLAGVLSDQLGYLRTFSALGIFGILIVLFLRKFNYKQNISY